MTPTDRARYLAAYEAAFPGDSTGRDDEDLWEIAEWMRSVETANSTGLAARYLFDAGFAVATPEEPGRCIRLARTIRAALGITDPPELPTASDPAARLHEVERERDEAQSLLREWTATDEAARRSEGARCGIADADDSAPCLADFADAVVELRAIAARRDEAVVELRALLDQVTTQRDEARAERDRLRDILDAERGVRGPEGWVWYGSWWRGPLAYTGSTRVHRSTENKWEAWTLGQPTVKTFDTALEAMEAADAAKEQA